MVLGEIIEALDAALAADGDREVRWGFDPARPHSWRGSYDELSFPPAENVSLSAMADGLKDAIDKTFEGYKGGSFTMGLYTRVYMDPYGRCPGNAIGQAVVAYWTGSFPEPS